MSKHELNKYTLIIYSSRNDKLFGKKMLNAAIKGLETRERAYKIIDLYKDGFDPIYRSKDLALHSKPDTTCKHAISYQELVKESNELIFIYPTRWNGIDAMTKGFCDKVFLTNGFWKAKKTIYFKSIKGTMGWIKKATVFTSQHTKTKFANNSGRFQMTLGILGRLNVKSKKMFKLTKRDSRTEIEKLEFLRKITKRCIKRL